MHDVEVPHGRAFRQVLLLDQFPVPAVHRRAILQPSNEQLPHRLPDPFQYALLALPGPLLHPVLLPVAVNQRRHPESGKIARRIPRVGMQLAPACLSTSELPMLTGARGANRVGFRARKLAPLWQAAVPHLLADDRRKRGHSQRWRGWDSRSAG